MSAAAWGAAANLLDTGLQTFSSLYGSAQSASAARAANNLTRDLYYENRDWMEHMDATKYQRARTDLEKAGYNPLMALDLSGGHLAATAPVMQNEKPNRGELYLNTAKALSELRLTNQMAQTEKTKQELNRAQASGSFGLPGLFNMPISRLTAGINAVRNLRSNPSSATSPKAKNRDMDGATLLNMVRSGFWGTGS